MNTRGSSIGANGLTRASHIAPGARCENVIQLAGLIPPGPVNSFAWSRGKKDHASTYRSSPRGGANSSVPSREELRLWGLAAEKTTPHSFSSHAALKLAQLFNAMVEIAKSFTFFLICLFGGLVITGGLLSPFIYLSFFRLH